MQIHEFLSKKASGARDRQNLELRDAEGGSLLIAADKPSNLLLFNLDKRAPRQIGPA